MFKLDVKVGDWVDIVGPVTIRVDWKTGQRTRWAIDGPAHSVRIRAKQEVPASGIPRKVLPPLVR